MKKKKKNKLLYRATSIAYVVVLERVQHLHSHLLHAAPGRSLSALRLLLAAVTRGRIALVTALKTREK
jgi:hypothetical protein